MDSRSKDEFWPICFCRAEAVTEPFSCKTADFKISSDESPGRIQNRAVYL